ncbi:sterol homeostasis protein [Halocaridina rubra]|uniref:Protein ARV n=1 Tax=Halocaridina rubra TaxID=373956 RepID=A0AAN8ZT48_HALRR
MAEAENKEYVCINCASKAKAIYKRSDGNFIKLLDCLKCGQPVDRYVECEKSIIFMDMVLQDISAYRHILFNADNFTPQFYLKLAISLVLSEAYIRWTYFAEIQSIKTGIKNNEAYLYMMCLVAAVELGLFGLIIYMYSFIALWCSQGLLIYNACLLGQCGRLANIPAMIWYETSSLIFQLLKLAFVIVSSIQSIRVALHIGILESVILIAIASVASYSSTLILQPLLIEAYQSYYEV